MRRSNVELIACSLITAVAALGSGCAAEPAGGFPQFDAGRRDLGADGTVTPGDGGGDSGPSDLGGLDAGLIDARMDAPLTDAGVDARVDSGFIDAGRDSGVVFIDFGTPDMGTPGIDAGPPDLGTPTFDAGSPPTGRRGLTYGVATGVTPAVSAGWTLMSCYGDIATMDDDRAPGCDPYTGDTPCSEARPILCYNPDGSASPSSGYTGYWSGGSLASTSPIAGDAIGSLANADEICASTFGVGFRMAEFHLGGAWSMLGNTMSYTVDTSQRNWVQINDQLADCWE